MTETASTLRSLLVDANLGVFPPVDGGWTRIAPWRAGLGAVIAFTGHAFMAVEDDASDADLTGLGVDGYGGAHAPRVIQALAGTDGWIDSLDAVLVRDAGRSTVSTLVERGDLVSHPRALVASRVRDKVRILGLPDTRNRSLVTVARGLGGLVELGIETDGHTDGVTLLQQASTLAPDDEPVIASVAPGNARALRTFLRAGFRPVASVQLYQRSSASRTDGAPHTMVARVGAARAGTQSRSPTQSWSQKTRE